MLEWLSLNRASIAAAIIIVLLIAFVVSLYFGRRQSIATARDAVFGDPERTRGGWPWAVCGVSALLLLWFYFSWAAGRAFFPDAANEMCQIAKIEAAVSPIEAALPIGSRYYKSTLLVSRNSAQLDALEAELPRGAFTDDEQAELLATIELLRRLMANASDPANLTQTMRDDLTALAADVDALSARLRAGATGLEPSPEALVQPSCGITIVEIPTLPQTPRGVLFDAVAQQSADVTTRFGTIRNHVAANAPLIADIKARIAALKEANKGEFDERSASKREDYVKAAERIFRRLDDGTIFPAASLRGVNTAIADLHSAKAEASGSLRVVDALFFPGQGVVKSRTQCTEQGSARWLPKPTDVIDTFGRLANPTSKAAAASGG